MRFLPILMLLLSPVMASCGGDGGSSKKSGSSTQTMVVSGWSHNLVLRQDGSVQAWGANTYGQLGDGTFESSSAPVPVHNLSNVIHVSAGWSHSLAVKGDGSVWAWGSNSVGQMGTGGYVDPWGGYVTGPAGPVSSGSTIPTQVSGINNVLAVAAGGNHSLALKADGSVWGWGGNPNGQVGVKSGAYYYIEATPIPVQGLDHIIAIATGTHHSLALRSDGTVWAWGSNSSKAFGNPSASSGSPIPLQVPGLTGIVAIAAGGFSSMGLKNDGTVWWWGRIRGADGWGKSWYGHGANSDIPMQVEGITDAIAISHGWDHLVALRSNGEVWTWGNNWSSQLGNGSAAHQWDAGVASEMENAVAVGAGPDRSFAVKDDGSLWAWGNYTVGDMGNGVTAQWSTRTASGAVTQAGTPLPIPDLEDAVSVSAGTFFSVAISSDGQVRACGTIKPGSVSTGAPASTNIPELYSELNNVAAMTPRGVVLFSDGTVGSLASYYDRDSLVSTVGLQEIVTVESGGAHHLALTQSGEIYAWGKNDYGQLGDGTIVDSSDPVLVPGLIGIQAIACGPSHSLAVDANGDVWGWGKNVPTGTGSLGLLGTGSLDTTVLSPIAIVGLSNITAVAASYQHNLAVRSDGTVWA